MPPPEVKRHDPDDPYLVVAADKGTATFSDYANAISKEYGFWLGDAFASGGSAGYDHKAMGITARGAWESVKRHFREMGIDTQTTDFTVAGIGDMSGDVFGNGMLLSRHIKLVAAFDHRHIFLDPTPDPEASFKERERLFKLPRSSWADYDAKLISAGGGVHPRSAKSIAITPRGQAGAGDFGRRAHAHGAGQRDPQGAGRLDLQRRHRHLRQGQRRDACAGRRPRQRRAARQRPRASLQGIRRRRQPRLHAARARSSTRSPAAASTPTRSTTRPASTPPITRSTSRSCSGLPIAEGELTEKQRNALLAEMTDDVAALVLRDNFFQTQSLSVTGRIAPQLLDAQQRFIQFLEKTGRLNRALEFLPADEEIAERRAKGIGLTGPERAVLLAYSKIWLYDELLASTLPDDPWIATALARYFPNALRARYAGYMPRHPLKREIIATYVTNSMVNRVGSTFVHRLLETTGAQAATKSCARTCSTARCSASSTCGWRSRRWTTSSTTPCSRRC